MPSNISSGSISVRIVKEVNLQCLEMLEHLWFMTGRGNMSYYSMYTADEFTFTCRIYDYMTVKVSVVANI